MRRKLSFPAVRRALSVLLRPRARHWSVLAVGAVAIFAYVSVGYDSPVISQVYVLIAILAATALTVSALLGPSRVRLAWLLIAMGQASWALGDVTWSVIEATGGGLYPSVADVLYVLGYPLLAVGLGLLLRSGSRGFQWGDLVDVLIVTLASLLVLWPIVFQPALETGWSLTTLAGFAYATGDVLLLGLVAALFFHGERRSAVIWMLVGSLLLVFVGDLIFYVPALGVSDSVQVWSDTTWLAAYVLIAASGVHPAERRSRVRPIVESPALRQLRFVGVALLTMPVALAVQHLVGSGRTDWRVAFVINSAVALLVVLRLGILLRQVDGARREASNAKSRFETVFESAGLGISIIEDGRLKRTNPAFQKLVGYTARELATMRVEDVVHPDDFDARVDPPTISGGGHATFERRLIRSDGKVLHARVNLTFSAATGLSIAVIENVTGQRELEEQMREAQKMEAVGRLAGGIAHDFNNILTVVSGHTELLRDQLPLDAQDDVDIILHSVRRANDLTRQLLTFSRREEPATAVIEPADIFRDTEVLIRTIIGGSVNLETRIKEGAPPVVADPVQLGQVMLNLAVNARDAMPDGGKLTFTVDDVQVDGLHDELPAVAPGHYCRVTVEDTGSGMDEKTRSHVFEPFYTTKEVGKGTGLGLAISYGIVTQAGGHIFVESQVGRGTRFQILLPAADAAASIAVGAQAA
jgi:PAS domain S-box-containing protein